MKLPLLSPCMVAVCFASAALAQSPPQKALQSSTQILVVTTPDWNAVEGVLQRYERPRPDKKWKVVGNPITIVVGKNGLGWGAGLVPTDNLATRGALDPVKKEGDGRSPAGVFRLGTAFGYAAQEQTGWRMPYVNLTPSVECVDDPGSKFYNRVVDRAAVSPDWNSSEHMLLSGGLYRWGIVVDHNANPVTPGSGSCVFMHIWRGQGEGTVGCTAMPQEQLESVLAWLDPARKPLLVQLPRAQYERLRRDWKLPELRHVDNPNHAPTP
ncbi:MAG TPA: L,D-transpeptidase family protein [Terriglobales bacterium]|nr:L,D-transpeptidase family protein [Terriglobales bacterium]